jgi:hypothetical protein
MFAVHTNHAASQELDRHVTGWMTWTSVTLKLVWLGFADLHTGIDHYMIAIGSRPMSSDLNYHWVKYTLLGGTFFI